MLCPVGGDEGGEALDKEVGPDLAQGGAESDEAREVSAPPIPSTPRR